MQQKCHIFFDILSLVTKTVDERPADFRKETNRMAWYRSLSRLEIPCIAGLLVCIVVYYRVVFCRILGRKRCFAQSVRIRSADARLKGGNG